jgi:hypothetical protein
MPIDLVLDLGSNTGAVWDGPGPRPMSAPWRVGGGISAPGGGFDNGPCFLKLEKALLENFAVIRPTRVTVLSPLKRGGNEQSSMASSAQAVELALGMYAIIQCRCTASGIPCFKMADSTARKHFVGNGRATKPDVQARCRQLGWVMKTPDECDAAAGWWACKAIAEPSYLTNLGFTLFQERAR